MSITLRHPLIGNKPEGNRWDLGADGLTLCQPRRVQPFMGTMPLLFPDALAYVRMARGQGHVVRAVLGYTEECWKPTAG